MNFAIDDLQAFDQLNTRFGWSDRRGNVAIALDQFGKFGRDELTNRASAWIVLDRGKLRA